LTREEKTVKAFKVVSRWSTLAAVAIGFALLPFAASADSDNERRSRTVKVDCGKGDTIAKALKQGEEGKPLVIVVRGVCNEIVSIPRDDVTLQADPVTGGSVNGGPPDPNGPNVITITGRQVTIDGLSVTGGRNGIQGEGASRLTILNCTVHSGRTGIVFFQGASGTVDNCTLQGNPRDGLAIESASATVINSTITQNGGGQQGIGGRGILVTNAGGARIGITNRGVFGPNTISGNISDGIGITIGASAFVGGNTISANGRFGVSVVSGASADLVGGNMITNNGQTGVLSQASQTLIGDSAFGAPTTVNTISSNGATGPQNGGIQAFAGGQLLVSDATISNNTGVAVQAFEAGVIELRGTTAVTVPTSVQTAGANVQFGSTLRVREAASIVSGTSHGILASNLTSVNITNANVVQGNGPGAFGVLCFTTSTTPPITAASAATLTGNLTHVTGTAGSNAGCNVFP